MKTRLKVPKLGMTMGEATFSAWTVEDGASVTAGETVCTIETDKVEQEIVTPVSGTIRQLATPGETYEVGAHLAEIES